MRVQIGFEAYYTEISYTIVLNVWGFFGPDREYFAHGI